MEFIGRNYECELLRGQEEKKEASLIAIYGRRRVGKTRLIEEFYKNKKVWKFEGLERQPKRKQIKHFLSTLSEHAKDPLYKTAPCSDWIEVFKLLDSSLKKSAHTYKLTLFFDELPYMSNRRIEMISDFKWAWDNLWCNKKGLTVVLCGSVASFMVDSVINSSALYGRIHLEICLKPISLKECYEFFGGKRSYREIIQLYLFCGGIPAYLLQFNKQKSIAQSINALAFSKDGYFTQEFDRIFKDVFHEEHIYRKIIMLFCTYKSLKIIELSKLLNMTDGGGFERYLHNLEKAGFIRKFVPLGREETSKLKRFSLDDEYLHFYFKFILPHVTKIQKNTREDIFSKIMQSPSYKSWAGLAFERMCIKHADEIMKALRIEQLVKEYGPYYDRHSNTKEAIQIDLVFDRYDSVVTLCEMKYYAAKIGKWIIEEIERKIQLFRDTKKTFDKVLIAPEGITKDLEETHYFSHILSEECLFGK